MTPGPRPRASFIITALLVGCGGGPPGDGDDTPGDDTPGDDTPGDGPGGDDAPGGPDATPGDPDAGPTAMPCTGTVSGGLAGTLSNCLTPYVYGSEGGTRWATGIVVSELDGAALEVGSCGFEYLLPGAPTTGTTYSFANITGGVSNLYQHHPTAPLTIWACGTNGTVIYGSGLALSFTSVTYLGETTGVQVYEVHGHVGCHYVAQDGAPPIDLALTF